MKNFLNENIIGLWVCSLGLTSLLYETKDEEFTFNALLKSAAPHNAHTLSHSRLTTMVWGRLQLLTLQPET